MTLFERPEERRRRYGRILLAIATVVVLATFVLPRIPMPRPAPDPSADGISGETVFYFNLLPLSVALLGVAVLCAVAGLVLSGPLRWGGWIALALVGLLTWGSWAALSPYLKCWDSDHYAIDFEDAIVCR